MRMILVLCLVASASVAQAKRPLIEVGSVSNGLLWVGIANEIRDICPTISARMGRALSYLNSLNQEAKSLGYSKNEIDAFRKSEANKALLRARGEAYLQAHGAAKGNPETYCAVGRAEIEKSSQIGVLLRAK